MWIFIRVLYKLKLDAPNKRNKQITTKALLSLRCKKKKIYIISAWTAISQFPPSCRLREDFHFSKSTVCTVKIFRNYTVRAGCQRVSSRFSVSRRPLDSVETTVYLAHQFHRYCRVSLFLLFFASCRAVVFEFSLFIVEQLGNRKRRRHPVTSGCKTTDSIFSEITVCLVWLMWTDSELRYYWSSRDTLEKYVAWIPLWTVFTVVLGRCDTVMQKPRKPENDIDWNLYRLKVYTSDRATESRSWSLETRYCIKEVRRCFDFRNNARIFAKTLHNFYCHIRFSCT